MKKKAILLTKQGSPKLSKASDREALVTKQNAKYSMFCNWPSKKALYRLEHRILDAVSQFDILKNSRAKAAEKARRE